MKPRTKARSVALQALYEIDLTEHSIGLVLDSRFRDIELGSNLQDLLRLFAASRLSVPFWTSKLPSMLLNGQLNKSL